jgi:uncharacterized protein YjiS (DUF1127 family)
MSYSTCRADAPQARPRLAAGALLIRLIDASIAWRERARQRRMLAGLNDRMLADIGLDRAMIGREIEKPFWRR